MRGVRLAGRYEVVDELGSGGFARTYIAKDLQRPGRPECVVKHLAPSNANTQVISLARRLFQTEAETLERLGRHDRIPLLLAYFEEGGEFFLVEEYIRGHRLSDELGDHEEQPEHQVVALVCELLNILVFVHGQGVIHRDIKPSNVIRDHDSGRLFLIDFGAVKDVGEQFTRLEGEDRYRTVGIGSQGYAAPEQLAGRPRFASDVYAVGMIGIQALTGRYPVELPSDPLTSDLLWRDLVETSDDVATVLEGMTRCHLSERYATASEPLSLLVGRLTEETRDAIFSDTVPRSIPPSMTVPTPVPVRSPDPDGTGPTEAIPAVKRAMAQAVLEVQHPLTAQESPSATRSTMSFGDGAPRARRRGATIAAAAAAGLLLAGLVVWGVIGYRERGPAPVASSSGAAEAADAPRCRHERVSFGDRVLTVGQADPDKAAAARHFGVGAYVEARAGFQKASRTRPDPESRVYAANATLGDDDHPTIAAVVPFSSSENRAVELLWGVVRAQERSRGGVRVRVAVVDDGNDPKLAGEIALCLALDPRILAVVGHGTSDASLSAAPVYGEHGLVMVAPIASAVELSESGSHVFRTMPSDRHAALALAKHLGKHGKRRIAMFVNRTSAYSRSFAKEVSDALFYADEGKVVAEFDMSSPADNAFENVKKSREQGAEALVLAAESSSLDRALQVVRVNGGQLPLFTGDGMYSEKTLQIGGDEAIGMILAVPSATAQRPAWLGELGDNRVTWRTLLAYDATEVVLEGLGADWSRAGVKRALSAPDFALDGAGGPVRFEENGDLQGGVRLVRVARLNGSLAFVGL